MNSYQRAIEERKKQHLLRTLPLPPEGIDFYSNDYLGLATSGEFSSRINKEIKSVEVKNGATGSRLLSGNSEYAISVENKVARFHREESALIYSSGYTANLGLLSCLGTSETTLVMDELIHASLIDGARLGKAQRVRFQHNSVVDLKNQLEKVKGQKIVIVESIYSMDGDICPLEDVITLCKKYDAMLIVDEAHAIGIYGESGEGFVQSQGLESDVTARIITYGKGPGIHGSAVIGPKWLTDYQTNFSRPFIFSTAPTMHHFASISAFYDQIVNEQNARAQLREVVDYFVQKRASHPDTWLNSKTQIQTLIVPGNEEVVKCSEKLRLAVINALPIRTPSVPKGKERIRFCLHSFNTLEEIDRLFDVL